MNDFDDENNNKPDFAVVNRQEIQELLSLLDLSDGFTIALAECNFWQDGVALVAALDEEIETDPEWAELQIVDWEFNDPELRYLLDELRQRLAVLPRQEGKKLILVLRGLENAIAVVGDYPKFLVDLNFVRDAYIKYVPYPVLFVLPDYAITRFAQFAGDFWAWRSGVFKFQTSQEAREFAVAKINSGRIIDSYIKPEKQERIDLLHRLLMETNPSGSELASNRNAASQINILIELGIAYGSLSKFNQAIEFELQALALSRKLADRNGEAKSLNYLGNAYYSLSQYQQAIQSLQQALEIFREIDDRNGEASSIGKLGIVYHSLSQYHKAILCLQQSLGIFREIGNRNGEASSIGKLGIVYHSLSQYQQAIQFLQQSLEIFREIGDSNGEAFSLNSLGIAYDSLGQYQQAIHFSQQSLEIFREIGDSNGEASSLNSLGIAYKSLGQYQLAIQFYQQSLEINREIGDRNYEAVSLINLGEAYRYLGQYQKAIYLSQYSLEICREIGDRNGEANSLNGLGIAYKSLGQYQQAIQFYQQSLEICREIGDRHGEANSLNNLAVAFKALGHRSESIEAFNASRKIYEELGLYHKIENSDKAFAPLETEAKEPNRFELPDLPKRKRRKNLFQKILDWFRHLWATLWGKAKS